MKSRSPQVLFSVLLLIPALVSADISEEHLKLLRDGADSCGHEAGLDEAVVQAAKFGDYSSTDPRLPCAAHCWFEKFGFMDKRGHITPNELMLAIAKEEERFFERVAPCLIIPTAEICDKALETISCLWKVIMHKD